MEIRKVYMSKVNARKVEAMQTKLAGKAGDLNEAREKLEAAINGPRGNPREWDLRVLKLEKEIQALKRKINRIIVRAKVSPAIAKEITKEMGGEK